MVWFGFLGGAQRECSIFIFLLLKGAVSGYLVFFASLIFSLVRRESMFFEIRITYFGRSFKISSSSRVRFQHDYARISSWLVYCDIIIFWAHLFICEHYYNTIFKRPGCSCCLNWASQLV